MSCSSATVEEDLLRAFFIMDLSPQEGEVQVLFIQTPSSDSHCAFNHININ